MDSIAFAADFHAAVPRSEVSTVHGRSLPYALAHCSSVLFRAPAAATSSGRRSQSAQFRRPDALSFASNGSTNSVPTREGIYIVSDFMTGKEHLHVVKPTTTVDEALDILVEKRITGFPVIDDDWKLVTSAFLRMLHQEMGVNIVVGRKLPLDFAQHIEYVGVVSDYDLLALDSISGGGQHETNMFPDVDSSWKTFNEIQKLLSKTNGKVISDVMTTAPLVVRENTNLEDAVRILLVTKHRRLPVVDGEGKLVGILTRGNIVRAALQIKATQES